MIDGAVYRDEDGACVVPRARRTSNALDRMRGLLGRPPLGDDEGLLITRCGAVHTLGMGYALDLAFLDRDGVVLEVVEALAPWRMAGCARAAMTLELAPGTARRARIAPGTRLRWEAAA